MDKMNQTETKVIKTYITEGSMIGTVFGCAIGIISSKNNVLVGMIFGISICMFIGLTIGSCIMKKDEK